MTDPLESYFARSAGISRPATETRATPALESVPYANLDFGFAIKDSELYYSSTAPPGTDPTNTTHVYKKTGYGILTDGQNYYYRDTSELWSPTSPTTRAIIEAAKVPSNKNVEWDDGPNNKYPRVKYLVIPPEIFAVVIRDSNLEDAPIKCEGLIAEVTDNTIYVSKDGRRVKFIGSEIDLAIKKALLPEKPETPPNVNPQEELTEMVEAYIKQVQPFSQNSQSELLQGPDVSHLTVPLKDQKTFLQNYGWLIMGAAVALPVGYYLYRDRESLKKSAKSIKEVVGKALAKQIAAKVEKEGLAEEVVEDSIEEVAEGVISEESSHDVVLPKPEPEVESPEVEINIGRDNGPGALISRTTSPDTEDFMGPEL